MNDMIEVARNSVQSWEIDQMGHMNVQFYVQRASDGLAALAIQLGLGPRRARERGLYWHTCDMHVRFLRERRVGAAFLMRAGVISAQSDRLRVYLEMVGTVSGAVAAAFTLDMELRDDTSGERRELDDTLVQSARRLQVARPTHGEVRGVSDAEPRAALTLAEANAKELFTTYQACILPSQCDPRGLLSLQQFMAIVSNAVPNLLARARSGRADEAEAGGAALEYRYVLRRYPCAGDTVTVRTGLKAIGAKTYSWCHWLFDLETGEALASAEAIGVALDLESRRAIAIPDAMRERLNGLLVDNLEA